jgi:protease-4
MLESEGMTMQDEPQSGSENTGAGGPFVGQPSQEGAPDPRAGQPIAPDPGYAPQQVQASAAGGAQIPGQAPQTPPAQPGVAGAQYSYPHQQPYQWQYPHGQRPAPQPRKSRTALIVVIVLCGIVLFGGLVMVMMSATPGSFTAMSGDAIALVHVQGIIAESTGGGPLGLGSESGTQTIVNQLEQAGRDRSVKAVVIRINSPGGSAAASQEIYDAVKRLRDEHSKPVIASMGDMAASGGYYIAAGADEIYANPATLTGSIGVIMQSINLTSLFERYGIKSDTIKSGPYKDTGSMWRNMTEEERKYWQLMVDDVYDQFVQAVAEGRSMEVAEVKKLADGRVFTGQQALDFGLVDQLGGLRDALESAKRKAGITGLATIKDLRHKTFLDEIMSSQSGTKTDAMWRMLEYERANPARHLLEAPVPRVE